MEKKQNSIDQLELDLEIWFTLSGMHFPIEIKNSIQRAKAMHREETEQFGAVCCLKTTQKNQWSLEGLYNETFL